MAATSRGQGKGYQFLVSLVGHQGAACVPWPMSCDRHGYGHLGYNGDHYMAHRLMCELAHGPAPSADHEAAHLCGNGDEGCVNPNHLAWKTHEENMADMPAHGTAPKKGKERRKLSDEQVSEIRAFKGRLKHRELAAIYGVHHRTIGLILTGQDRPNRPKRHRGHAYPEPQRSQLSASAKVLRSEGKSFLEIGNIIGVSRVTAATLARL